MMSLIGDNNDFDRDSCYIYPLEGELFICEVYFAELSDRWVVRQLWPTITKTSVISDELHAKLLKGLMDYELPLKEYNEFRLWEANRDRKYYFLAKRSLNFNRYDIKLFAYTYPNDMVYNPDGNHTVSPLKDKLVPCDIMKSAERIFDLLPVAEMGSTESEHMIKTADERCPILVVHLNGIFIERVTSFVLNYLKISITKAH